ncbi:MAG: hypothetical protein WC880_03285 [Candidatus Paceibacterota bacterium]
MIRDFICATINFLGYSPLPELMQGAGISVLTLLISFAIGIFIHHLGDGERKGNFLDLHIALDQVWLFKPSLLILLVVVISPFFMGVSSVALRMVIFFVWAVALLALFWILLRLYTWVKGDKDDFRLNYFTKPLLPLSPRDKVVSWSNFWATDWNKERRFIEKDFFIAFSAQIDSILQSNEKEKWNILPQLLESFLSNIQNRNKIFILVFPEFFPKVLEWHFIFWKIQFSKFAKDKGDRNETEVDIKAFESDYIVDQIIRYVTKEAFTGNTSSAFSYFKHLEDHINKRGAEQIVGSQHIYVYIKHLPIYNDILDQLPKSSEAYDIWEHYFPSNWKVTISNLKDHIASRVWLDRFLEWSRSRIWSGGKEWDKDLGEVSKELFPSVDPIIWAKILAFVMRSWSDSRVRAIVENDQNFGYVGRIFTGWGDGTETDFTRQHEEQLKETINVAIFIFSEIFTVNNLNGWLTELSDLSYPEDSTEHKRKEQWKEIFVMLRKHREKTKETKNETRTQL